MEGGGDPSLHLLDFRESQIKFNQDEEMARKIRNEDADLSDFVSVNHKTMVLLQKLYKIKTLYLKKNGDIILSEKKLLNEDYLQDFIIEKK